MFLQRPQGRFEHIAGDAAPVAVCAKFYVSLAHGEDEVEEMTQQ